MHLSRRARVLGLIAAGMLIVLATGLYGLGDAPAPPEQPAAAVAPTKEPTVVPEVVPTSPPPTVAARAPSTPTPAPSILRPITSTSFTISNTLGRGMPVRLEPRSARDG